MTITEILVEQCRKPQGRLGVVMTRIMNRMDAGLVEWALQKTSNVSGGILEVGCGGGETIRRLTKKHRQLQIDGIDYSEDAVKLAIRKNRVLVKAGSVKIQLADVERLPFQNEKFNTILAIRTHYFWEHLEAAFTELFRVLKPQGELLVFSEMFKIQYHMDEFNTDETLTELLYKVGFQTVSCERKKDCLCISAVK